MWPGAELRYVELLLLLLLLLPQRLRRLLLMPEGRVLFVCVENACRSLMAEAIFNADPPKGWVAVSAGTRPAPTPNPRTGPMLAEIGIELPHRPPRPLEPGVLESASIRVTMGCLTDASCPSALKSLPVRDWGLPDPTRMDDAGFRAVRDEIRTRVDRLKVELAGEPGEPASSGRRPSS